MQVMLMDHVNVDVAHGTVLTVSKPTSKKT